MLPHTAILSLPPTKKHRRRTVHMTPPYNFTSIDQLYFRELSIDDAGIGCALWDGGLHLTRFLYEHREQFVNKRVLEIGAGVGVPSILIGRYAKLVIATDYLTSIIDNCEYNIKLNAASQTSNVDDEFFEEHWTEEDRRTYLQLRQNVAESTYTALVDWHDVPDRLNAPDIHDYTDPVDQIIIAHNERKHEKADSEPHQDSLSVKSKLGMEYFDYLIGAEVMYTVSEAHRRSLARTIDYYLIAGGHIYIVQSANREGIHEFCDLMINTYSYKIETQEIDPDNGENWMKLMKEKRNLRGFQQRKEIYWLYKLTKPAISNARSDTRSEKTIEAENSVEFKLPTIQYALKEDVILAHTVSAITVDQAAAILSTVTSDKVVLN